MFYIFGIPLVGHHSHPYYTERDKEVSKKTMMWFSNYVKYGYVLCNDYKDCYKQIEMKVSYLHDKIVMRRQYRSDTLLSWDVNRRTQNSWSVSYPQRLSTLYVGYQVLRFDKV